MALKADVSVEFVAKYGGEKIIKNAGYYFSKNGNYFKKIWLRNNIINMCLFEMVYVRIS